LGGLGWKEAREWEGEGNVMNVFSKFEGVERKAVYIGSVRLFGSI
jgi:hypothetical protein